MWLVEIVNAIDGYKLRYDGIYSRNVDHLWGIFTSPFIHENFAPHLLDNTIPLVFMGVIIALRGARRLALVTAVVIVLGGLGTWLIGPAGVSTIGASGLVFGYTTYLLTRGLFNRNLLELLTAVIVGVIWGGTLLSASSPTSTSPGRAISPAPSPGCWLRGIWLSRMAIGRVRLGPSR